MLNQENNLGGSLESPQKENLNKCLKEIKDKFAIDVYENLSHHPRINSPEDRTAVEAALDREFSVITKLLGDKVNKDYIRSIVNFVSIELASFSNDLLPACLAVRSLISAWGDNISYEKLKISFDKAIRTGGGEVRASSIVNCNIVPFLCGIDFKIQDENAAGYLQNIAEFTESIIYQKDSIIQSLPSLLEKLEGKFNHQDWRAIINSLRSIQENLTDGHSDPEFTKTIQKIISAARSDSVKEQLSEVSKSLDLLNQKGILLDLRRKFASNTLPQLLNQLGKCYRSGDLLIAAQAITDSLVKYSDEPIETSLSEHLSERLGVIEKFLAVADRKLLAKDVSIITNSIDEVKTCFTKIRINPMLGMKRGVLPISQSLSSQYYPEIFLDIAKELSSGIRGLDIGYMGHHYLVEGSAAGMQACKESAQISDIRKMVDAVLPMANESIYSKDSRKSASFDIYLRTVGKLKSSIDYSDIKILVDSILEFQNYKYPSDRLCRALPEAVGSLGIAEGLGLICKLLRIGLSPRLDILKDQEIKELNNWIRNRKPGVMAESAELSQRARDIRQGSLGRDFVDKIIAAELVDLKIKDDGDAQLIGTLMDDLRSSSLAPVIKKIGHEAHFTIHRKLKQGSVDGSDDGSRGPQVVINLQATKGLMDLCHESLAGYPMAPEFCGALMQDSFQPIRMSGVSGENLGVIYTVRTRINNQDALVVAGIHPDTEFLNAVDVDQFAAGLIRSLSGVATSNTLQLYINTGGYNWRAISGISEHEALTNSLATQLAGKTIMYHDESVINYPIPGARSIHFLIKTE